MINLINGIMQRRAALFFVTFFMVFALAGDVMGDSASDYYRERLEFDDEGNLLMTTHDLKATTKITYRTIGWTIKRYDMPMDAEGQQYAIIKLKEYGDIWYKDDPNDSRYMYCYYYGEKDDIWKAIGKADKEWQHQLSAYGDYVYIDEIITVCESGNPKGSLNKNGTTKGEVYFTYAGISKARPWASPESLLTHFNKRVKFPAQIEKEKYYEEEVESSTIEYKSGYKASVRIAQGKKNNNEYDVMDAVPTGKELYVDGRISRYMYDIILQKIKITVKVPVRIVTTYHLSWTDYYGNDKKEDKKVIRWYLVERKGYYWKVADFSFQSLKSYEISNYVFQSGKMSGKCDYKPDIVFEKLHGMEKVDKQVNVEKDGGLLTDSEGKRPCIPDEDQKEIAEEAVGNIKTKNDYLKIDTAVIINKKDPDAYKDYVTKLYANSEMDVYEDGMIIPDNRKNGAKYQSNGIATYKIYGGENVTYGIDFINPVSILTPVVCNGNISDDKAFNQRIVPDKKNNSLIIGRTFYAGVNTYGEHKEFKGYGTRDYGDTTYKNQVKFPFEVYKSGKRINADTWIDADTSTKFVLPIGTSEGTYRVDFRSLAANSIAAPDCEFMTQNNANKNMDRYVAVDSVNVNVIGRIYGLTVGDDSYIVGKYNCNGKKINCRYQLPYVGSVGEMIPFLVTTVGDMSGKKDSICVRLKYYYIDKAGSRSERKVYYAKKIDGKNITLGVMKDVINIDANGRTLCGNEEEYGVSDNVKKNAGKQKFCGYYSIPGEIYIFDTDDYSEGDVVSEDDISGKRINSGNIIVNFDITTFNNDKEILSYINRENYKQGYCDMWLVEGGAKNYRVGKKKISLMEGDTIICPMEKYYATDYRIVGTH